MQDPSMQPMMALVADVSLLESVGTTMSASASGVPLVAGADLLETLERASGRLKVMVVEAEQLTPAIDMLSAHPDAYLIILARTMTDRALAAALRAPRVVGFLALRPFGVRDWELSYLIRRVLSLGQPPPSSADLLTWGGSTVTWRPQHSRDRDQTVRAVELVAGRFGIGRRLAANAADAAHELLMNAMYDAPVDASGHARYAADRQAEVALEPHEVPTLRLTVDPGHLALDISDPFGRLPRGKLFGGVLRGRSGATASSASSVLDVSHGGAGLGLFNLHNSAAIVRVEVIPYRLTQVSWVLDRGVSQREQRTLPRSLYYVQSAPT